MNLLLLKLLDLLLMGLHGGCHFCQINQWILDAERKADVTPTSTSISLPTELIPNVVFYIWFEELRRDWSAVILFVLSFVLILSVLEHKVARGV